MSLTSLDPVFLPLRTEAQRLYDGRIAGSDAMPTWRSLSVEPDEVVADYVRALAHDAVADGATDACVGALRRIDALLEHVGDKKSDIRAALNQVLTAVLVETGRLDEAMTSAATTLSILSATPKRKDTMFSRTLALTLYDLSLLRVKRNEYRHAERQIAKALKLFERLSRIDPVRFGSAVVMALDASTAIYRSRVEQVNLLAHYQVATTTYLELVRGGAEDAVVRLVASLEDEGRTLARMGRYREAVQFFTRALKYLARIEADFTPRQLALSIDLGEALLNVGVTRDKGVHLLNTMLHKATRLGAADQHVRITNILLNAKSRTLDILGLWHKIFPK